MSRRVEYVELGGFAVEQRGRLGDSSAAVAVMADGVELVFDCDPLELLAAIGFAIQQQERAEPGTRAAALLRARMAVAVGGYERPADIDDDPAGLRDLMTDVMHLAENVTAPAGQFRIDANALVRMAGSCFEHEREEWANENASE